MKNIILLIAMLMVLGACSKQPVPPAPAVPTTPTPIPNTCLTNNDCVRTGCSGIICQSNKQQPVFSTCESKPEYECYNEVPCGCIQGSCQWSNEASYTGVLDKCLAEKKRTSDGVPVV